MLCAVCVCVVTNCFLDLPLGWVVVMGSLSCVLCFVCVCLLCVCVCACVVITTAVVGFCFFFFGATEAAVLVGCFLSSHVLQIWSPVLELLEILSPLLELCVCVCVCVCAGGSVLC